MNQYSVQIESGSSTTKITITSINSRLLRAVVWICCLQIFSTEFSSSSDVSETIYRLYPHRGSSTCVLSMESCTRFAAVGQQVYLNCSTCRNKSGTVDWWYREESFYFNKTVLVSNGKSNRNDGEILFYLADDKVSLIINNIRHSDAGLYTCVCDGGFGDKQTTNLTVTDYVAVNVGSNATLNCFSSTSDVEWSYKSSKEAQSKNVYSNSFVYDDFKGRFSVPRSSFNFSLVIEDVQFSDSGYYTCHEDSGSSSNRHTVLLIASVRVFTGRPEFSLPCPSSAGNDVSWKVWPIENAGVLWATRTIYSGGEINEKFIDRFTFGQSKQSPSNCTLTIKQVQTRDTGVYAWIDQGGFGDRHYIQLLVVSNETDDTSGENSSPVPKPISNSSSVPITECQFEDRTVAVYVLSTFCVVLFLVLVTLLVVTLIVRWCRQRRGKPRADSQYNTPPYFGAPESV